MSHVILSLKKRTLEQFRTSTLFSLTATSPASHAPFLCPPCSLSPPSLETWDRGALPLFRLPPHAATTKPAQTTVICCLGHILKARGGLGWAATIKLAQTMVYHHLGPRWVFSFISLCFFFLLIFIFLAPFHINIPRPLQSHHHTPTSLEMRVGGVFPPPATTLPLPRLKRESEMTTNGRERGPEMSFGSQVVFLFLHSLFFLTNYLYVFIYL